MTPQPFTATLGLPAGGLSTAPRPKFRPPHTAPAPGFLRDTYLVHVLAQVLESTAQRVQAGSVFFQHTGLHKRAERLHAGADGLLETLFGDFDSAEATTLNNLSRTLETATAALVTLAVAKHPDYTKLERVADLLAELAEMAGLKAEEPAYELKEEAVTE